MEERGRDRGSPEKIISFCRLPRQWLSSSTPSSVCPLCCYTMSYSAFGECGHSVCWICAVRLRVLAEVRSCPFCKFPLPHVYISKSNFLPGEKVVELIVSTPSVLRDEPSGICFEDAHSKCAFEDLRSLKCWLCTYSTTVPTFSSNHAYMSHLREKHDRSFCTTCSHHGQKSMFPIEWRLYALAALEHHMEVGDSAADVRHLGGESSIDRHYRCPICKTVLYDADAYNQHVGDEHIICQTCERREGELLVPFWNFGALRDHWAKAHYICTRGACQHNCVVFRTLPEFSRHNATEHGEGVNRRGEVKLPVELVGQSESILSRRRGEGRRLRNTARPLEKTYEERGGERGRPSRRFRGGGGGGGPPRRPRQEIISPEVSSPEPPEIRQPTRRNGGQRVMRYQKKEPKHRVNSSISKSSVLPRTSCEELLKGIDRAKELRMKMEECANTPPYNIALQECLVAVLGDRFTDYRKAAMEWRQGILSAGNYAAFTLSTFRSSLMSIYEENHEEEPVEWKERQWRSLGGRDLSSLATCLLLLLLALPSMDLHVTLETSLKQQIFNLDEPSSPTSSRSENSEEENEPKKSSSALKKRSGVTRNRSNRREKMDRRRSSQNSILSSSDAVYKNNNKLPCSRDKDRDRRCHSSHYRSEDDERKINWHEGIEGNDDLWIDVRIGPEISFLEALEDVLVKFLREFDPRGGGDVQLPKEISKRLQRHSKDELKYLTRIIDDLSIVDVDTPTLESLLALSASYFRLSASVSPVGKDKQREWGMRCRHVCLAILSKYSKDDVREGLGEIQLILKYVRASLHFTEIAEQAAAFPALPEREKSRPAGSSVRRISGRKEAPVWSGGTFPRSEVNFPPLVYSSRKKPSASSGKPTSRGAWGAPAASAPPAAVPSLQVADFPDLLPPGGRPRAMPTRRGDAAVSSVWEKKRGK